MSSKAAKTPTKKTARKTGPTLTKAAATKAAATKAAATKAAATKTALKRATVATLAQDLKSLEKRLKGADTKNRKALKTLEGVVDGIKVAAKKSTSTQKAALTRGLSLLEVRMETYLERAASEARAGVRTEFAGVTSSGADFVTLQQAVQAAHARLDDMDTVQRGSLARLNRHIADLATSVDNQLKSETQARKAASAALDAKIDFVSDRVETRIDRVEQETADALQVVGNKITEFAAVLEDRAKTSDTETAERLADLAQETQSEFNSVQTDVTARLEALEMIASASTPANPYLPANADDPRIDKMGEMIQSLQDELSRMHARMAAGQTNADPMGKISPSNVVSMSPTISTALNPEQDNPYAAAARALEMSAAEPTVPQMTPEPESVQARSKQESHIPQEFDPTAFNAQMSAPQTLAPNIQTPTPISVPPVQQIQRAPQIHMPAPIAVPMAALASAPPALPVPPLAPPMASSGAYAPLQDDLLGGEPIMPAPLPVSTYDNPAYAEADDMRAERIGGSVSKRPSLPNIPVSSRTLRIGAVAVGVGVVGLFAMKTILGGPDTASTQVRNDVPIFAPSQESIQNAELTRPNQFEAQPAAATPPLGQYAETQTPNLTAGAQDTLDAAVEAGNPIAQFQKGLVQLQTGQMKEGARLIRLSANRNQPAAQYRLAKLYESGTGISKDPITARELIERAASGGNRIAMHDLANYYAYGQGGLDRDMGQALEWFTKAAERGVVDSQFNVAFLREGNEGVPADTETALFWYYVAARQGDQGAPDRIEVLNEEFDPATLADIKSRADRFNPKPVDEAANGIFRNVPWNKTETKTKTASAPSSAEILRVRDAQTLLSSLGYEVGAPDGVAGSKTRNAVKSFESVNGLPETGQVTEELIQKLEIATGA